MTLFLRRNFNFWLWLNRILSGNRFSCFMREINRKKITKEKSEVSRVIRRFGLLAYVWCSAPDYRCHVAIYFRDSVTHSRTTYSRSLSAQNETATLLSAWYLTYVIMRYGLIHHDFFVEVCRLQSVVVHLKNKSDSMNIEFAEEMVQKLLSLGLHCSCAV